MVYCVGSLSSQVTLHHLRIHLVQRNAKVCCRIVSTFVESFVLKAAVVTITASRVVYPLL